MDTGRLIGVLTAASLVSVSAEADFTLTQNPAPGEPSHAEIFEMVYSPGVMWSEFGTRTDSAGRGLDLSNSVLSAVRIDDFGLDAFLNPRLPVGGSNDQMWVGAEFQVAARSRNSAAAQSFGYDIAGDGAGIINLFDVTGDGVNVGGAASVAISENDVFAWVRGGDGNNFYTRPSANFDDMDHVVTYFVQGFNDGLNRFMLFFEDSPGGGDLDFNDLTIEITTVAVPEPATAALFFAALGLWLRRRP